uniref:FYVE-type zinc finger domain-containing protein n=1 Tax=Neobodo designis TaxID=312471 RepID=A0A7S1MA42_NEODS
MPTRAVLAAVDDAASVPRAREDREQCPFCRVLLRSGQGANGHLGRHRFPRLRCRHCLREGCTNCVATPVSAPLLGPWCGECPIAPALAQRCPALQRVPRRTDEFDDPRVVDFATDGGGLLGSNPGSFASVRGASPSPAARGGSFHRRARSCGSVGEGALESMSPQRTSSFAAASVAAVAAGCVAGGGGSFTRGSFAAPLDGAAVAMPSAGNHVPRGTAVVEDLSCSANDCTTPRRQITAAACTSERRASVRRGHHGDPGDRLAAATRSFAALAVEVHVGDAARLAERALDRADADASSSVARRVEIVEAARGFLRCAVCREPYGTVMNRRRVCACCLASLCAGCSVRREMPGRHQWEPEKVTLCPPCAQARVVLELPAGGTHDTWSEDPTAELAPATTRPRAATLPTHM